MGMLSFGDPCAEVDGDPPRALQGSRCRAWQDPLGCTSCKGLSGFEGEAGDPCQPLQGGLGGSPVTPTHWLALAVAAEWSRG